MSYLNVIYSSIKEKKSDVENTQKILDQKTNIFNLELFSLANEIVKKFKFNENFLSILIDNRIMNHDIIDDNFKKHDQNSFIQFVQEKLKEKGLFLARYNDGSNICGSQATLNTSLFHLENIPNFLNEKELKMIFNLLNKKIIKIYTDLSSNNPVYGSIKKNDNEIKLILKRKILIKMTDFSIPHESNNDCNYIIFSSEKDFLNFFKKQ